MATATTPADLVRDAEAALTAARAAETFLANHPGLQAARLHAEGSDPDGAPGQFLEVQLDQDLDALNRFAKLHSLEVEPEDGYVGISSYRVRLTVDGVDVTVTAYEELVEDSDEKYPCQLGVYCDNCGTEWSGDFVVSDRDSKPERLEIVRRHARNKLGWSCGEAGDYCPTGCTITATPAAPTS
ncbi:hypothetical protein BX265_6146 [Streptomyces sp. TLI_235]|nr:hypothetical protein [Streptomyces sp. TLI_235]PBC71536.1 hypothetical protein BX265_6146 [Streptomyces sp. TLI_235]